MSINRVLVYLHPRDQRDHELEDAKETCKAIVKYVGGEFLGFHCSRSGETNSLRIVWSVCQEFEDLASIDCIHAIVRDRLMELSAELSQAALRLEGGAS